MERLRAEYGDQPGRFEQLKPCLTGDNPDRYARSPPRSA